MSDIANRLEQPQKSSRSYLSIAVWVIVLGLLAVLGWGLVNSTAPRPEVGEMATKFNLEFFDGYEWEGWGSRRRGASGSRSRWSITS